MAAGVPFSVLKDLPSDVEPSETSSFDSEDDEWETDSEGMDDSDVFKPNVDSEQAARQQQQHGTVAAASAGSKLAGGPPNVQQPNKASSSGIKQVKNLRSTLLSNTSGHAFPSSRTGNSTAATRSDHRPSPISGSSSSISSSFFSDNVPGGASGSSYGQSGSGGKTGMSKGFFDRPKAKPAAAATTSSTPTSSSSTSRSSSTAGGFQPGFLDKPQQQRQSPAAPQHILGRYGTAATCLQTFICLLLCCVYCMPCSSHQ